MFPADARALPYCEAGLWDTDAGVRGESAKGMAELALKRGEAGQTQLSKRLIKFFIACRNRDVGKSVFYAITRLPCVIAASTLFECAVEAEEARIPNGKIRFGDSFLTS